MRDGFELVLQSQCLFRKENMQCPGVQWAVRMPKYAEKGGFEKLCNQPRPR
jgi:hypothetical protein